MPRTPTGALIWTRTRHTNARRSALRECFPGALEVFDELADRDAMAILDRGPAMGYVSELVQEQPALKAAGRQRNFDT